MKLEKANKDMQELTEKNGFHYEGETTYDGQKIYTRRWKKTVDVAWYGEQEATLEIKISMSYGYPLVRIIKDGRQQGNARDYQSPKRAMNAIAEIVSFAGYEM